MLDFKLKMSLIAHLNNKLLFFVITDTAGINRISNLFLIYCTI